MKKFVLGVISTLGAFGIGKMVYKKGRRDEAERMHENFSNIEKGIAIGKEKESE